MYRPNVHCVLFLFQAYVAFGHCWVNALPTGRHWHDRDPVKVYRTRDNRACNSVGRFVHRETRTDVYHSSLGHLLAVSSRELYSVQMNCLRHTLVT